MHFSADRIIENAVPFLLVGAVLALLGVVWLLVRVGRDWNGWVLLAPLSIPVYMVRRFRRAAAPLALVLAGLALAATPAAVSRLVPIDLGERARLVHDELHLTLTGWNKNDYSLLRNYPEVVVLQMANPDVTDGTLKELAGCGKLRKLDLGHSAITDAGLAALANLPALEELILTRTAVTDRGVSDHLGPLPGLKRLNVEQTAVSAEARKAWKAQVPGRRVMPMN